MRQNPSFAMSFVQPFSHNSNLAGVPCYMYVHCSVVVKYYKNVKFKRQLQCFYCPSSPEQSCQTLLYFTTNFGFIIQLKNTRPLDLRSCEFIGPKPKSLFLACAGLLSRGFHGVLYHACWKLSLCLTWDFENKHKFFVRNTNIQKGFGFVCSQNLWQHVFWAWLRSQNKIYICASNVNGYRYRISVFLSIHLRNLSVVYYTFTEL